MQPYSPFSKPIQDIQTLDLQALKQTSEGWYVEYKRESPNASAIAKSISAFANTYGGWLFIGIGELSKESPLAGTYPGIAKEDIDAILQRIRKSAADLLNPPPHFESKFLCGPDSTINLPEDRAVICVWVPRSSNAPHVHKSGVIYRRVSDSSEPKPENDRFILDQLWRRADEAKRRSKDWYDRDPEFSESEKSQPYVRLMLIADKWSERDLWIEAELEEIRSIFASNDGISSIPFDTVNTSSEGFIARQLRGNDPHNLTLTWRLRRNLSSDVIIPLPLYKSDTLAGLKTELGGYNNSEQFIRILQGYQVSKIRVVDLNFLFNILVGVANLQFRLSKLANWSEPYHVKVKILNAWRTIPFVDLPAILDGFEKNGPAMLLDSVVSMPRGTDPENFLPVSTFDELEGEAAKLLVQAFVMFMPLALSFGIPSWMPHDEESTVTPYHEALQDAGRRAINIVQPLRNQRRSQCH